jgi:hypothetical protein
VLVGKERWPRRRLGAPRDPAHRGRTVTVDDISVKAGDGFAYAGVRATRTREERAIRLFEMRGHEIEQAGEAVYWVPSWDGQRTYTVHYPVNETETESCTCPDHVFRDAICIHILATAVRCSKKMAQRRRNAVASLAVVGELA